LGAVVIDLKEQEKNRQAAAVGEEASNWATEVLKYWRNQEKNPTILERSRYQSIEEVADADLSYLYLE
jgi:hypothetical protein